VGVPTSATLSSDLTQVRVEALSTQVRQQAAASRQLHELAEVERTRVATRSEAACVQRMQPRIIYQPACGHRTVARDSRGPRDEEEQAAERWCDREKFP